MVACRNIFSCSKAVPHDESSPLNSTWQPGTNTILLLNSWCTIKVNETPTCCSHQQPDVCERQVSLSLNRYRYICEHCLSMKLKISGCPREWEKWDVVSFHLFNSRYDRIQQQEIIFFPRLVAGCKIYSSTVELYQLLWKWYNFAVILNYLWVISFSPLTWSLS